MITAGPTGATPQKGPPRTSVSPASNTPPAVFGADPVAGAHGPEAC